MNALALILRAFEFLLLFLQALMAERYRQEGREEVAEAEQEAHEIAVEAAAEIDRTTADADLDALRERMRHYQRDRDAL